MGYRTSRGDAGHWRALIDQRAQRPRCLELQGHGAETPRFGAQELKRPGVELKARLGPPLGRSAIVELYDEEYGVDLVVIRGDAELSVRRLPYPLRRPAPPQRSKLRDERRKRFSLPALLIEPDARIEPVARETRLPAWRFASTLRVATPDRSQLQLDAVRDVKLRQSILGEPPRGAGLGLLAPANRRALSMSMLLRAAVGPTGEVNRRSPVTAPATTSATPVACGRSRGGVGPRRCIVAEAVTGQSATETMSRAAVGIADPRDRLCASSNNRRAAVQSR